MLVDAGRFHPRRYADSRLLYRSESNEDPCIVLAALTHQLHCLVVDVKILLTPGLFLLEHYARHLADFLNLMPCQFLDV